MRPRDLHWTESNIESINVSGWELSVVASGVFVLGAVGSWRVTVTFRSVSSARREVTEYIGDPKAPMGFRPRYVLEELSATELPDIQSYGIEGVSADRLA